MILITDRSQLDKHKIYYHENVNQQIIEYKNIHRFIHNRNNAWSNQIEGACEGYYNDLLKTVGLLLDTNQIVYEISEDEVKIILNNWRFKFPN